MSKYDVLKALRNCDSVKGDLFEKAADRIEELEYEIDLLHERLDNAEAEHKRLRAALTEAMEWNWLDDDMPKNVIAMCKNALKGNDDEQLHY